MYAQTANGLYTVNPSTLAATHVCDFSGIDPVFDMAEETGGAVYAMTVGANATNHLYSVNTSTCATTLIGTETGAPTINGMAFDPYGGLYAVDTAGKVYGVDTGTGAISSLGNYGNFLQSSGDMVSLADGSFYAIANDYRGQYTGSSGRPICSECSSNSDCASGTCSPHNGISYCDYSGACGTASDCDNVTGCDGAYCACGGAPIHHSAVLVSLDPNTSFAATVIGSDLGYTDVYGLAYAGGALYAFDSAGHVIKISTAGAVLSVANNASLSWYGAGSSPHAP
jgi:hypothetical protein